MYIITNYGGGENYRPSVFKDKTVAEANFYGMVLQQMREREIITANEYDCYSSLSFGMSPDFEAVKRFIENNDYVCVVLAGYCIGIDEGENVIQLFEVELLV